MSELKIAESVHGTWFYHLSRTEHSEKALCGARTMHTSIPLSTWGHIGHLNERYCADCWRIERRGDMI